MKCPGEHFIYDSEIFRERQETVEFDYDIGAILGGAAGTGLLA